MKVLKRILGAVLSLVILISTTMPAFAMDVQAQKTLEEQIILQTISLDDTGNIDEKEFEAVALQNTENSLLRTTEITNNAIQSINTNAGLVEVTTIIPYKQLENGELINSFDYVDTVIQPRGVDMPGYPITSTLVDVSVTVTAYFLSEYRSGVKVYRHAGIEAYWSSSKSTVSVSNLNVVYESLGDLYKYPDCYDDLDAAFVQSDYWIASTINVTNPAKNSVYMDANNSMPLNRVLIMNNYFEHCGLIVITVTYNVNGQSQTRTTNYQVYSK